MDMARGIAPCAVAGKVREALPIQNCFRHYGARRIAGAQEQNVEMPWCWCHIALQRRSGLRARHAWQSRSDQPQASSNVDITETCILIFPSLLSVDFQMHSSPRNNLASLPAAIGPFSQKHHHAGMNPVPQSPERM